MDSQKDVISTDQIVPKITPNKNLNIFKVLYVFEPQDFIDDWRVLLVFLFEFVYIHTYCRFSAFTGNYYFDYQFFLYETIAEYGERKDF